MLKLNEKAQIVNDFLISVIISIIMLSVVFGEFIAIYKVPEHLANNSATKLNSDSCTAISKLSYSSYVFSLENNSNNCRDFIQKAQEVRQHYACEPEWLC